MGRPWHCFSRTVSSAARVSENSSFGLSSLMLAADIHVASCVPAVATESFVVAVAVACFLAWVLSLLVGPKVAGKAGGAAILLSAVYPFAGFGSPDHRTTCDTFAGTYVINAGTYHDALQGNTRNA